MEVSMERRRILRWGSSHSLGVRAFVFSLVACSASIGVGQSVAQPIEFKTMDVAGARVTKPTGVTARGGTIDFPGATNTLARGTNSLQQVVDNYSAQGVTWLSVKPWSLHNRRCAWGLRTRVRGNNASGEMAGGYVDSGGSEHGFAAPDDAK